MDRFRDELRDMFDRQQADMGDIAGSRRLVMEKAMARHDEPMDRRAQLIAGLATAAIAVLVVVTFVYVRAGSHGAPVGSAASFARTSPTAVAPTANPVINPSPNPSPASGQSVTLDVSVSDVSHAWILLTTCIQPMTGTCHYGVVATANGGSTWSKPVQVGGEFDPTNGDAPRHVDFINLRDGFVYGGAEAFVTHDGGATWAATNLPVTYFGYIAGRGNRVWVSVFPCAKGAACAFQLYTSADAGRTWSAPYTLPAGFSPGSAVAFGDRGVVLEDMQSGAMELTVDGGVTWSAIKGLCAANPLDSAVATPDGKEIWEICQSYPANSTGPAARTLFVSEDGGGSWSRADTSQIGADLASRFWPWILVSNRPGQVLLASSQTTTALWQSGGHSWQNVGPTGIGFTTVKFASDGFNGWAIDVDKLFWFTNDGGASWKPMPAYNPVTLKGSA